MDWRAIVAVILATALAITLVAGFTIAEFKYEQIPDTEINFFSVLAGGMVAEIATFIALAHSRNNHKEDRMSETTETPKPTEPAPSEPPKPWPPEEDDDGDEGEDPDTMGPD